ncbi:hypothetical protein DRF59_12570 [Chryseobacterium flavum]|uniref:Uncharacterized protein n=1 Tax=Chryseobacterium flavum TaxID=415851 RepID=A0A3D9CKX5_9FLAO|nr:hypothetical protein [Chryseobacterium flavum]REC66299.1 hypothetical protein DRF59_12570 [Chryseobacterium flavum]
MLSSFSQLIIIYFRHLINKKIFLLCVVLLVLLGFFLIPNETSDYVTFYCNNSSIVSNKYWIGNLSGVFSNLIIYLLLFLIVAGDKEKDAVAGYYINEDLSPLHPFFKHLYKILAIYLISLLLLLVLNVSLILANIQNINIVLFIIPILYFCAPFLLLVSTLCYFVEYLLGSKYIKYFIYYSVFILLIIYDDRLLYITGSSELFLFYKNLNVPVKSFAIGFISKEKVLNLITVKRFIKPNFIYYKLLLITFTLISTYFLSFIRIKRSFITNADSGYSNSSSSKNIQNNDFSIENIPGIEQTDLSLTSYLKKDLFLLSVSINNKSLSVFFLFWILSFFVQQNFFLFILVILLLLSTKINDIFLGKSYFYNTFIYEKLYSFPYILHFISKFIIVLSFYCLLLIPYFLRIGEMPIILLLIFNFSVISIFQLASIHLLKNTTVANIVLIIMYISYVSKSPLIDILCYKF